MDSLFAALAAYAAWAMLALRVAVGAMFIAHGLPKLKGKMGGFMTFIGVLEVLGAVLVIVGYYAQLGGLLLAVVMIGAIYKKIVEWHVPYSATDKMGWEVDLVLLTCGLLLMTLGPGPLALGM